MIRASTAHADILDMVSTEPLAARHPHKVLNHLAFIRRQERLRAKILADPSSRQNLDSKACSLYGQVCHIELHPTDHCNLSCRLCIYGHDRPAEARPAVYPFSKLAMLSKMKPRSIVIAGGGEPTLYQDHGYGLDDLVYRLRALFPDVQLALITNGTYKPVGYWPREMRWIRLSLDAASAESYKAIKGLDRFSDVLQNFLAYLEEPIGQVGIGFLYSSYNHHEYAAVAEFIHDVVACNKTEALSRVSLQYRPLVVDNLNGSASAILTEAEMENVKESVRSLLIRRPDIVPWLRQRTNISAAWNHNGPGWVKGDGCYYAEIFRMVRANGDLRPCCILPDSEGLLLGNLFADSESDIVANILRMVGRQDEPCSNGLCRMGQINDVISAGLMGELSASPLETVQADLMF